MRKKKKIDLSTKKFYYSNKDFDFTIIEIKEYDFIDNFLEIDENYLSEKYIKKRIYIQQFPQKKKKTAHQNTRVIYQILGEELKEQIIIVLFMIV